MLKRKLSVLGKALTTGEDILVYIGGVLVLAMMIITVAEIVGRTWFSHPISGSVELPSLFLVLVTIIALAVLQRQKGHIGVNILQERLKGRARSCLEFSLLLSMLFVAGVIAVYGWRLAMQAKALQLTTMGPLFVTLWPFMLVLPFGFGLLTLRVIIQLIREGRGIITRSNTE